VNKPTDGKESLKLEILHSPVNRNGDLRSRPDLLEHIGEKAQFIVRLGDSWVVETHADGSLALKKFNRSDVEKIVGPSNQDETLHIYLGEGQGQHFFALATDSEHIQSTFKSQFAVSDSMLLGLRELSHQLSATDYHLALHGQAIANWHRIHIFCPRCGEQTFPDAAGSIRRCPRDNSEHYPRTDPAIITILRDKDDRILLGRQRRWEEGRYSTFAGFVEAGESFEEAVVREVKEEAGVEVSDIKYLASQPWPFPNSIMIAFSALVKFPDQAMPDGEEIESLRWYTREQLTTDLANGSLTLPPSVSVSRKMIEAWYGRSL
jgi:NAD+ diphosphatase